MNFCEHHTRGRGRSPGDDHSVLILSFGVFPFSGGRSFETLTTSRKSNTVETFFPHLQALAARNSSSTSTVWKMLIYGLDRRTRAKEWQLGGCPFRLYMIVLENWLSSLVEAYRPRETRLAGCFIINFHGQPNFADLVASGSADQGRFPDIFRGLTIELTCSFYFEQECQEENFTGVSAPGAKADRTCHSASLRTPTLHFSGPKSTRTWWTPKVGHVRSLELIFPALLSIDSSVTNGLLYVLIFS